MATSFYASLTEGCAGAEDGDLVRPTNNLAWKQFLFILQL